MDHVDRSAIFQNLCLRNQLRREAQLPLLDLKTEYDSAIRIAEAALRRAIGKQYEPQLRAEILDKMRACYGPLWPSDMGGRYLLGALLRKALSMGCEPRHIPREYHPRFQVEDVQNQPSSIPHWFSLSRATLI
jgi:hypothetical protein